MLSRVADSIFWMSRYIERVDNTARFVNVNWRLMLDGQSHGEDLQWEPLVRVTGDEILFFSKYGQATKENVIQFLTFDPDYSNSVLFCLRAARENARSIREILPGDLWEQLNTFYLLVNDAARNPPPPDDLFAFFTQLLKESYEFNGIVASTMPQGEAWHFCRLGSMIERADKTSRILDVKYFYLLPTVDDVGSPLDQVQWAALLRSASALQAYRQHYGVISPGNIIQYLLLGREFPRSVRFCIDKAQASLHIISGCSTGTYSNEAERLCGQLASELAYTSVEAILEVGLHEFIDKLQLKLNELGEALYKTFFILRPIAETPVYRQYQEVVQ